MYDFAGPIIALFKLLGATLAVLVGLDVVFGIMLLTGHVVVHFK